MTDIQNGSTRHPFSGAMVYNRIGRSDKHHSKGVSRTKAELTANMQYKHHTKAKLCVSQVPQLCCHSDT